MHNLTYITPMEIYRENIIKLLESTKSQEDKDCVVSLSLVNKELKKWRNLLDAIIDGDCYEDYEKLIDYGFHKNAKGNWYNEIEKVTIYANDRNSYSVAISAKFSEDGYPNPIDALNFYLSNPNF